MERYGSVIGLRPDKELDYRRLHDAVWPAVLERLRQSHIHNYSIFLRDGVLFSYFEYTGNDYEADMDALAADPIVRDWWALTDPCQQRLPTAPAGEMWSKMEELFHVD